MTQALVYQIDEAARQQLADEYYASLEKPADAKQPPQFCLCVIGLVGAGKSTVLRKLCREIPMVRQSGDEIRALVYKKGLPKYESLTIADIGGRTSLCLKQEGYRVAHDNDFANPFIRAEMQERNRRLGIPEIWIRVDAPEDFIVNKLRRFDHTYLFKDADEAVANYYARKQLHTQEAEALARLPYIYIFDTSRADLDEQAAAAAQKIRKQLEEMHKA